MVRAGVNDFVKHLEGKGYYDSCGTVDQEVDLEIFVHIVTVNQEDFLTIQRGKHRKPTPTKHSARYTVLPFAEFGAVRDDINGPDTSRKVPGGGAAGSGEEFPWFSNPSGDSVGGLPS